MNGEGASGALDLACSVLGVDGRARLHRNLCPSGTKQVILFSLPSVWPGGDDISLWKGYDILVPS